MKKSAILLAAGLLISAFDPALGCTTLFTFDGESAFVGFNLDYSNYNPRIWFVPASDGCYGRFCFGFDANYRIAEGGMNEKGLFIAVNALNADAGWKSDPSLKDWEEWEGWFETGVPDGILAMCATVDEAVRVFSEYNLFTLNRVKFLVADRTGASVVIEWSRDGLIFTGRPDNFQVSTNFVTSNYTRNEYPCGRYKVAEQILSNNDDRESIDKLRAALSAAHLEFQTPTVFSTICDIGTGDILIYYFHNYEEVVELNLNEELEKGGSRFEVDSLFSVRPYVADVYRQHMR